LWKCAIFFCQKGQILQIESVNSSVLPILYTLKDLMGDSYPGNYYNSQLTHSPAPNFNMTFFQLKKFSKKNREENFLFGEVFILSC
jgi:hypothetical protein